MIWHQACSQSIAQAQVLCACSKSLQLPILRLLAWQCLEVVHDGSACIVALGLPYMLLFATAMWHPDWTQRLRQHSNDTPRMHLAYHPAVMQVGQMTQQPIKTQFGYHIILCEGRKQ